MKSSMSRTDEMLNLYFLLLFVSKALGRASDNFNYKCQSLKLVSVSDTWKFEASSRLVFIMRDVMRHFGKKCKF